MEQKRNPRRTAIDILCDIDKKGAYSNILLRKSLRDFADMRDRAFVTELVYGVIQNRLYLDYVLDQFSKIKTKKMTYDVLNILRVGAYQILFLDKVPQSAAVNESVELAKKMTNRGSVGFINGVLRAVCRKMDTVKWPENVLERLSVEYSFAPFMVSLFYKRMGEDCEMLLKTLNKPSSIVLRVNTLKTNRENLLVALEENGIKAEPIALCPDAILCGGFDIGESSLYKEGLFSVQDSAAQVCCLVLNPQPNERVLDVCAAPGGKTCYIAELMQNTGYVEALDIYEHKKKLIDEQAKRLGLSIVHSKVQDALSYESDELFDKVLVDAPCSGLGIIARKPEIKWNRTKKQIDEFSEIQYTILKNAARFVAVGGELVYSTCTLTEQENEEVVRRFISEFPQFNSCDISPYLPDKLKEMQKDGMITLWPHKTGIDGFFIAKLRRVK